MNYFFVVLIAVALSMDAFSFSLSIGTIGLCKSISICLSMLVGIFHFLMPLLGTLLGSAFVQNIHIDMHILSSVIFFYIAILMFKDFKKEENSFKLSLVGAFVFALGVSLDSFGVGFALHLTPQRCLLSFLTFSLFSSTFTYLGLKLGRVINALVGEYSILLGASIMAFLAIINFCQFLF